MRLAIKYGILTLIMFQNSFISFSQKLSVNSPNQKIVISLYNQENKDAGEWYLKVSYQNNNKTSEIIPHINLGISRNDQIFSKELRFFKSGKQVLIEENYKVLHGKKSNCINSANEVVVTFENPGRDKLNLILRAYNDGVAFRYEFEESKGKYVVNDELTSYEIPQNTKRWLEKWDASNEGLYKFMKNDSIQNNWCYPALFNSADTVCWYLIHEADVDRNYCGTKLSNLSEKSHYKLSFPESWEGAGDSTPTITLPWKSPWRVIIIGSLADIVESTLIDDVSSPSKIANTGWIKPGLVSWNYWSNNHGTKDFKIVCEFADLAAAMGWPYTLLDWEWDAMENGGNVEDAAKYILSIGVKPLIWYNSGAFKWIQATPRDRMFTHESRMEEFSKLKKMGFAGVKIDFFLSEKQDMIKYYLDILDDAALNEMMVYFHGCLVPRGWARTYPHLMTYEGVRGAEWYNNGPELTATAPEHNTVLPFTRNVVGSMDYTPVTFTNSQYPHITSYGHELALSILFESGFQHLADRPEGYYGLPDAAKSLLKEVPAAWDNTKLIEGYPGKDVVIARNKGTVWYVGGINAENNEKSKKIKLDFLPEGKNYRITLVSDGKHDKEFATQYMVVNKENDINIKMLRRGGFAAIIKLVE